MNSQLNRIVEQFVTEAPATEITPLGDGLINDTYLVTTAPDAPKYVLQRINHHIFTDVKGLQDNIKAVTSHIRSKLAEQADNDIDCHVLSFMPLKNDAIVFISALV